MQITEMMAQAINNLMPGNSVYRVGDALRVAIDQRHARKQDHVRYVDGSVGISGDGKSWDKAYKTITEGIAEVNGLSGLGATLIIAPGTYIEVAGVELTASDVLIYGSGSPEQCFWYGSGVAGTSGVTTDDLLTISGDRNMIDGLGLFVRNATGSAIKIDDSDYNIIRGCHFSPTIQDAIGYNVSIAGGTGNIIEDNYLYGTNVAAVLINGDPVRTIIRRNVIVGGNVGVEINDANYNTLVAENWFSAGSGAGENMTNAITIDAAMDEGSVTVIDNIFEQSGANAISDSKTGTASLFESNTNLS